MNTRSHLLVRAMATLVTVGVTSTMAGTPLLSNGSFEEQRAGTSVVNPREDRTTFTDWRIFNIGTPPAAEFSATLVPGASDGKVAMQLKVDDTGAADAEHGMDRDGTEVPVNPDVVYRISFDAAHVSGDTQLILGLPEYDADHNFVDAQFAKTFEVTDSKYRTYEVDWKCINPATKKASIAFRINGIASLKIDNVRITEAPAN